MKIVILDAAMTTTGDLSWEPITSLGDCTLYPVTEDEDIVERLRDADIAVVNKVAMTREIIEQLPNLKMIAETATGFDNVDTTAAQERGIAVANVPAYSTESVAQMVFAHILNYTTHVELHNRSVKQGDWQKSETPCYWNVPLTELAGKSMGIIGFGNIGSAVARIAHAFGMTVLVNSRSARKSAVPVLFTDRETVLCMADFLVLTCALAPETRHIINEESLKLMKPTAMLINTGRGPLVDETALANALTSGQIASAGIDVLSQEPPRDGSPLIALENCSVTPHIAWATVEARTRLITVTAENIKSFLVQGTQNRIV